MEPLKEMFNHAFYKNFASVIKSTYKGFKAEAFYQEVTANLTERSLNERLRFTSIVLNKHLPDNFKSALKILKAAAPWLKTGYTALVMPDYVALYGKEHLPESLEALKYFTVFGSSEFAIREFLKTNLKQTLEAMEVWAEDENEHVRRLASEGSRPRLPWSFKLDAMISTPSLTKNILEKLKADQHIYVRKSVANHLNDISKDNPSYMLDLVETWDLNHVNTKWIVKHACRSLIKKGDPRALHLFQFKQNISVKLDKFVLSPSTVSLGDAFHFSFNIQNTDTEKHRFVIDYAITYARPFSGRSRKVFKMKEIILAAGQSVSLSKKQTFRDFTTRTHYTGDHQLELMVNGRTLLSRSFHLQVPSSQNI